MPRTEIKERYGLFIKAALVVAAPDPRNAAQ
jgi:hypothetical protein